MELLEFQKLSFSGFPVLKGLKIMICLKDIIIFRIKSVIVLKENLIMNPSTIKYF